MTQPLSKHRHISFTAHYTGYIWYQMGISHQVFATKKGKSLAALVHPLESWAEKYVGGSMRSTLKQRHTLLDDQLKTLIEQHPQLQVLEIASGLSPRGWWFRQHYPEITYRELDLPDMAQTKQAALQQIEANAPEMLSVDLFTAEFKQAFDLFNPSLPLVVISEGLINYFDKPLLAQLIQSIAEYGQSFKELHYLTDLYPEPVKNKLANIIWSSSKLLKWMSRSAFSFHFTTPADVETFFMENGFDQVKVTQPKDYFDSDTVQQQNNQEHLGDLVWTIHAINKKHT
ncbi:class I SAM-dependent methyltransferase [Acinetobacter ursingii]|uniref:class I SAM-dependent methyltransferase n=1 Tax=Acinetobacter ursingii TaxID=108980 RepID=UPI0032B556D9